jgi:hypothetical protein
MSDTVQIIAIVAIVAMVAIVAIVSFHKDKVTVGMKKSDGKAQSEIALTAEDMTKK